MFNIVLQAWPTKATIICIFFVFFNIFVTGVPVKFGLLTPGRARQRRSRAYPGQGGNRTLPTHPNLS
jgi:hypothetical protein